MDNKGSRWNIWENMVMICEDHWLKLIAGCWNVLLRPVPSWRQEWHLYGFNITAVYCCNHRGFDDIWCHLHMTYDMTRFFRETVTVKVLLDVRIELWFLVVFWRIELPGLLFVRLSWRAAAPSLQKPAGSQGWAAKTGKMLACTTIKIAVEPMKMVFKMV